MQKLNLPTCFVSYVVYLNFALHELQIQKVVGIGKNLNTIINFSLNCLFIGIGRNLNECIDFVLSCLWNGKTWM